jgi:hypothetical protein
LMYEDQRMYVRVGVLNAGLSAWQAQTIHSGADPGFLERGCATSEKGHTRGRRSPPSERRCVRGLPQKNL